MDAQMELNSPIKRDIKEEKTESILFDVVALNLSKGKRKMIRFFFKVLGIEFKENVLASSAQESPYNEEFEEIMKRGEEDIKAGRVRRIKDLKELWNID